MICASLSKTMRIQKNPQFCLHVVVGSHVNTGLCKSLIQEERLREDHECILVDRYLEVTHLNMRH